MISLQQVTRVYNGKIGCMCGCNGKYTTNPAYKEYVGKERGYPVSDDECNMRSVKIMAKKVLTNPNVVWETDCAYVEDRESNKMQVIWFI
jgi:hypothetical protein